MWYSALIRTLSSSSFRSIYHSISSVERATARVQNVCQLILRLLLHTYHFKLELISLSLRFFFLVRKKILTIETTKRNICVKQSWWIDFESNDWNDQINDMEFPKKKEIKSIKKTKRTQPKMETKWNEIKSKTNQANFDFRT